MQTTLCTSVVESSQLFNCYDPFHKYSRWMNDCIFYVNCDVIIEIIWELLYSSTSTTCRVLVWVRVLRPRARVRVLARGAGVRVRVLRPGIQVRVRVHKICIRVRTCVRVRTRILQVWYRRTIHSATVVPLAGLRISRITPKGQEKFVKSHMEDTVRFHSLYHNNTRLVLANNRSNM